MTENEAIEELHRIRPYGGIIPQRRAEALDVAINALEEVQQYRQIGTVSTCRNAVGICKAMIERGINPDNITECINFEYNLVQRGYDLKKMIEMIEEHKKQFQIGTEEECREAVEKQPTVYDQNKVVDQLESELRLADKEKERCARENPLQFDSAKGYAMGLSNAIEIVKAGGTDAEN